jgi:pyruvate,orthophosphate dikinase
VVQSNYHGDEKISLFGEYKTRAQGYDIVSGVANVFPISEDQKIVFPKYKKISSLEESKPMFFKMINEAVRTVRHKFGNEIQIEFTIENNILYLLQVRGLASHLFQKEEIIEKPNVLQKAYLGDGLAASGGAVSGRVVFKTDRIDIIREKFKGDKIILIRPETNPEDVLGLQKSDGILTCLGGMTSHAVLQMRRFKKSGISNFSVMRIDEKHNLAFVDKGSNKLIKIQEGDYLTIDGDSGKVYQGHFNTRLKRMKV